MICSICGCDLERCPCCGARYCPDCEEPCCDEEREEEEEVLPPDDEI